MSSPTQKASLVGMGVKSGAFFAFFLFVGSLIGLSAWPGQISETDTLHHGLAELNPTLLFILLLPVFWIAAKTRSQIVALYGGYVLAGTRDISIVYGTFFPGTSIAVGVLCWLALAALLTLPWAIMWRTKMTALAAAWRIVVIVLLLSFPPFGFIGWLNPLVLAGYLYPGTGWYGVVQFLLLFAMIALTCLNASRNNLVIAALLGLSSVWTILNFQRPATPDGWIAMSTKMGAHPQVKDLALRFAYQARLTSLTSIALTKQRPAVLILPESVAGTWLASTKLWWQPVSAQANNLHAILLVGADRYVDNNQHFYNSVVDIGQSAIITTDRFPMPVGQWRPWTAPSAKMNILKNNSFAINGRQVALSVCYEDFLFWIQALTIWQGRPTVIISIANNWFAQESTAEPWIQARHMQLWADLWGLPLLRAINR